MPLFSKLFHGDFELINFFDHNLPFEFQDSNGFQITSWGERTIGGIDGHNGYDWLMPDGTPLLAVADGLVTRAGPAVPFYCPLFQRMVDDSLGVNITHEAANGKVFVTSASHMNRVDVRVGQRVRKGEQIGLSGHSGCTTVSHVHFNVRDDKGIVIDPYGWDGEQTDPWLQHPQGSQSVWLWLDGEAPTIFREEREPPQGSSIQISALRWMGWKDNENPNNQFIELDNRTRLLSIFPRSYRLSDKQRSR